MQDRPAAVAGQFYPANKLELQQELNKHFEKAKMLVGSYEHDAPQALIVPHAGYVFSATVAASAYLSIKPEKPRKSVFLIGSSHHTHFEGASIYQGNNYVTPLGKVPIDTEVVDLLIDKNACFSFEPHAHQSEHTLEVHLPFLQYIWKHGFKIIPIIIASQNLDTLKEISEALFPFFRSENLFVISTDFSHYPNYDNASKIDKLTADAIEKGDVKGLIDQLQENEQFGIPNLATSLCGWSSVLSLMLMCERRPALRFHKVLYQNSGDSELFHDHHRVVGYQSFVIA